MKRISSGALLEQLRSDTCTIILQAKHFQQNDPELLTQQPEPGKWSVAQVLEHLNAYGRYYLPEIEKALKQHRLNPEREFTPGWLGNYLTNAMKPTADKRIKNKMKAMKDYTPDPDLDSKKVVDDFLTQQQSILNLIEQAGHNNISKIRIPISIARFITLKLGDTFRFLIAHNQRHILQSENVLRAIREQNLAAA